MTADEARRQAIHQLWGAIVDLETGELQAAENKTNCALGWIREIPSPSSDSVRA